MRIITWILYFAFLTAIAHVGLNFILPQFVSFADFSQVTLFGIEGLTVSEKVLLVTLLVSSLVFVFSIRDIDDTYLDCVEEFHNAKR